MIAATLITIVALLIWCFLLVVSHAFLVYSISLDASSPDYYFLFTIKYFPILSIIALTIGYLLKNHHKYLPTSISLIPSLLLISFLSIEIISSESNIGTFTDPIEEKYIRACAYGTVEEVDSFIASGMDVNLSGNSHMYPLMAAFSGKNIDTFKYLLRKGADPNIMPNGSLYLNIANYIMRDDIQSVPFSEEYLKALITNGLDVNLGEGISYLILTAAMNINPVYLEILLSNGADANVNPTWPPIDVAATFSRWENVILLVNYSNTGSLEQVAATIQEQNNNTSRLNLEDPLRVRAIELIKAKNIDFIKALENKNNKRE